MKKDKRENYSKQLLIWGSLVMVALPFIFMALYNIRLANSAEIGETIGGITAPVVGLVGSILLYFALSAQIDSNKLIANQIEEDNLKEHLQKEEAQISHLYDFFANSITEFTFEEKEDEKRRKSNTMIIYKGGIALDYFVDFLQKQQVDSHNESKILENRDTREFISIIKSADLLIDALKRSSLNPEGKKFYKNLIEHQLTYKISPNFDSITPHGEKMKMCECGLAHGTFPAFILKLLINLKNKLETV